MGLGPLPALAGVELEVWGLAVVDLFPEGRGPNLRPGQAKGLGVGPPQPQGQVCGVGALDELDATPLRLRG